MADTPNVVSAAGWQSDLLVTNKSHINMVSLDINSDGSAIIDCNSIKLVLKPNPSVHGTDAIEVLLKDWLSIKKNSARDTALGDPSNNHSSNIAYLNEKNTQNKLQGFLSHIFKNPVNIDLVVSSSTDDVTDGDIEAQTRTRLCSLTDDMSLVESVGSYDLEIDGHTGKYTHLILYINSRSTNITDYSTKYSVYKDTKIVISQEQSTVFQGFDLSYNRQIFSTFAFIDDESSSSNVLSDPDLDGNTDLVGRITVKNFKHEIVGDGSDNEPNPPSDNDDSQYLVFKLLFSKTILHPLIDGDKVNKSMAKFEFEVERQTDNMDSSEKTLYEEMNILIDINKDTLSELNKATKSDYAITIAENILDPRGDEDDILTAPSDYNNKTSTIITTNRLLKTKKSGYEGAPYKIKAMNASIVVDYTLTSNNGDTRVNIRENAHKTLNKLLVTEEQTTSFGSVDLSYNINTSTDPYFDWMKAALGDTDGSGLHTKVNNFPTEHGNIVTSLFSQSTLSDNTVKANEAILTLQHKTKTNFDSVDKILQEASKMVSRGLKQKLQDLVTVAKRYDYHSGMSTELAAYKDMKHELQQIVNDILVNMYNQTSIKDKVQKNIEAIEELISNYDVAIKVEDSSRIFDQTVLSLLDATKISDDDNKGHLDDNDDLKLTFGRVGEYDVLIDKLTSQDCSVNNFEDKVILPFDVTTKRDFVDILESLFKSKKEALAEAYNPPDSSAWLEVTIDKNTIKTYCWENTSMRPVIKYCKNASPTEPALEDSDKLNYAAYVASMAKNSSGMDIGSSNFSTKAAVTTVASDTHPKLKLCAVNCYGSLKSYIKEVKLTDVSSNISNGEILDVLQPSEGCLHKISLVMAATLEEQQELSDDQKVKYNMENTEDTDLEPQENLLNSRIFHRIIHAKQTIWNTAPSSVNEEYNTKKLKSLENEIRCTNVKWSAGTVLATGSNANVAEKQVKDLKDPDVTKKLYELNTFSNKLHDISNKRAKNNETSDTTYRISNSRSTIYNAVSGMSTTDGTSVNNKIVVDYLMWQFCNFTNKKTETRQLGLELLWMTHVDTDLTIYNEAYNKTLSGDAGQNTDINTIPAMSLPSMTNEITSVISGPFKVELTIGNGKVDNRELDRTSLSGKYYYTLNTDGEIVLDIDKIQEVTADPSVKLPGSNASVLYNVNINIIGDISTTPDDELPDADLKYKSFSVDNSGNDVRSRLMPVYKIDAGYNSSSSENIFNYTKGLFDSRIDVWGGSNYFKFDPAKRNQYKNHTKYYLQFHEDVGESDYTVETHDINDNTFLANRRELKHNNDVAQTNQAVPLYRPYAIPVRTSASKPANGFAVINYVDALDVSGTASILGKYSIYSNNNTGSDISGVELSLKTQKFTQIRNQTEVSSLVCSFEFNNKNYVAIYKPKKRMQSVLQTASSGDSGNIKFKAILPSSFSSTDITTMNNLVNTFEGDASSNAVSNKMELMLVKQVVSDPFRDDDGNLMESGDDKLNQRFAGQTLNGEETSYTQKLISSLDPATMDPTALTKADFEDALNIIATTHTDDAANTKNVKLTNSQVTNLRVLFTLTATESEPTSPAPNTTGGSDIVFQNNLSTTSTISLALEKTKEEHIKSATFKLNVSSVRTLLEGEGSSGAPGFYSYNTTSLANFKVEDWITQTFTVTDNDTGTYGESTLSRTADSNNNLTVDVDVGGNKTYKIIARRLNDNYIYTIYVDNHNSITFNDDAFKKIKLDVKFGWKKDYYYNGTATSLTSNKNGSNNNSPPYKFNMTSSGQTIIDSHTDIFSDKMPQLNPSNISIDNVNKADDKRDHDIDHIHYRLSGFDNLNTQNDSIVTVGKIIYDKIKIEGTLPAVSVSEPTRLDVFDATFDASLNALNYTMVKSNTDMVITRDTTNDPAPESFNVTYLTDLYDNQVQLLTLLKQQRYVIKDAYAQPSPSTEYKIKISELLVTDYSLKTLYNINDTINNEEDASEGAEKVLYPNTLLLQPTRHISGVAEHSDVSGVKYGRKVLYRVNTNIPQTTELNNYKRMLTNSSTGTYPTMSVKYTFKVTFKTDREVEGNRRKLTVQNAVHEAIVTYDTTTGTAVTKLESNSQSVVNSDLLNTTGIHDNNFDTNSSANICLDLVKVVDILNDTRNMVTAGSKAVLFGMKAELTKVEISETKPEPVNAVARNASGSGVMSKTVTEANFDVFDIDGTTNSDLVNFDIANNNKYGDSCLIKKLTWNSDDDTFIKDISNNVMSYNESTGAYTSYSVTATNSYKQYTFDLFDTFNGNEIMSGSTRQTASPGDWTHNKIDNNEDDYIQFANANLSGTRIYRMVITPNLEITHNNTSVIYEGNSKTGYVKTTNIERDPTESYPIYINDFSVSTTRKAHSAEINKNNFGWSKKCSYVMENLQINASNNELFKSITSIEMGGGNEAVGDTPEIGKFVENVWTPSKLKISLKNIGNVGELLGNKTQVLDENGNNYFAKNFTGFIRNPNIEKSMVVPANGANGARVLNNSSGLTLMTTNQSHTYWKYDTENSVVGRDELYEFTFNGHEDSLKLQSSTWSTDSDITNTFTSWEDLRSDESRDPTTGYWSSNNRPATGYVAGWDTKNYYDIWNTIEIKYAIQLQESNGNGKLLPAPVDKRETEFKTTIDLNNKDPSRNTPVQIEDSFSAIVQSDKDSVAKIKTNTTWSNDGSLTENTLSTQMDPHKILNISLNTNGDSDGIYFNPAGKSFNNTYYINNATGENDASVVYNKYQTYAMKIAFKAKTADVYKTVVNLIDGNLDHSIKGTLAYENNTPYNFHKRSGSMLVPVTDSELNAIKGKISAIKDTVPSNSNLGRKWSSQNGDIENEKIRVYFGLDKQSRRPDISLNSTGVLHNSAMVAPNPIHNASSLSTLSTVICLPGEDKECGQTTGADIGFKYGEGFDIKITYCYIEYNITTNTDANGVSEDVRTGILNHDGENVVELSTDEQVKDKVLILDKTINKDTPNKTIEVLMRGASMTGSSVTSDGHHVSLSKFTEQTGSANPVFEWEKAPAHNVEVHQDTDYGDKYFSVDLSNISMGFESPSGLPTHSFGAMTVNLDNINYYAFVTARQDSNMNQTLVIQNSTATVHDTSTGDVDNSRNYTELYKEAEEARLAALQPSYEVKLKISDAAYGEWDTSGSNPSSKRFNDVVIRVMGTDDDGDPWEMGKAELNTANKNHAEWQEVSVSASSNWEQTVTDNFADFDGLTRYAVNTYGTNFSDTDGALAYLTTNSGDNARKGAYKLDLDNIEAIDELTMGIGSNSSDKLKSYIKTTINLLPKAGKQLSDYTNINIVVDDSAHFGKPIPLTPNGYSNTYIPSMMTTKLNDDNKSYGSIGEVRQPRRMPSEAEMLDLLNGKEVSLVSKPSQNNQQSYAVAVAEKAWGGSEQWWPETLDSTSRRSVYAYAFKNPNGGGNQIEFADGDVLNKYFTDDAGNGKPHDSFRFVLKEDVSTGEKLWNLVNVKSNVCIKYSNRLNAADLTVPPTAQPVSLEIVTGTLNSVGNTLVVDVKIKDNTSGKYFTLNSSPDNMTTYLNLTFNTNADQIFRLTAYDVATPLIFVDPSIASASEQQNLLEGPAGFGYIQDLNYTHQYEMLSDWNKTMNCLIMDITVKKTFDGSSTTKNLAVRTLYPDDKYPNGSNIDMIHSPLFPTNGTYYKGNMNFLYSGLRGVFDMDNNNAVKVLQIDHNQASLNYTNGTLTPLDAVGWSSISASATVEDPLRIASPLPTFVNNAHANRLSLQCIGKNVICGIELNNLNYVDSTGSKELITKDASSWFTQLVDDGVLDSVPNDVSLNNIINKFGNMGFVKETSNGCVTWNNTNTSITDYLKAHSEKAFEWLEPSMTSGNPAFQSLPSSITDNIYIDALKTDIDAANNPQGISTSTKFSSVLEYHIGAIEFRKGDKWKLSTKQVNGKTQIWRELLVAGLIEGITPAP
tara:strand:- start:181 stop:11982 length:11802 start_codon:yes stop_codon:yes gene_type:complete